MAWRDVLRALKQPRRPLGHVFDQDFAAAVQQEAVQRRLFVVAGNGTAGICGSAGAAGKDLDFVAGGVLEEKPAPTWLAGARV